MEKTKNEKINSKNEKKLQNINRKFLTRTAYNFFVLKIPRILQTESAKKLKSYQSST